MKVRRFREILVDILKGQVESAGIVADQASVAGPNTKEHMKGKAAGMLYTVKEICKCLCISRDEVGL